MARRRGYGEVERRVSASGAVTYRARYAMPDGTRYSRTMATRMDAEAWLVSERGLVDRDAWTPPQVRRAAEEKRQRDGAHNTVAGFAERYLAERSLRPTTIRGYRKLLASRILPYVRDTPLIDVSLAEINRCRIDVTRKVDKDSDPTVPGACPSYGRHIGSPKTRSGTRTVHVPPPFLKMLQKHLPDLTIHRLRHTALTLAGQHGATAAELQARAGHASQAAMAIYQHATLDRDMNRPGVSGHFDRCLYPAGRRRFRAA